MDLGDFHRAEDHLTVPIGTIVQDDKEKFFVFYGWSRNTVGLEMNFIQVPNPNQVFVKRGQPFTYHASGLQTILRKFPELKRFQHS